MSLPIPPEAHLLPPDSSAILKTPSGANLSLSTASQRDPNASSSALLVGRQAATADARIQHGSISRKQALLFYNEDNELELHHLESKYGTTVSGSRVEGKLILRDGDTAKFGNVGPDPA